MIEPIAEIRQLLDDAVDRAHAVTRKNTMRAVGAELRTAAAGEERNAAAVRPPGERHGPPAGAQQPRNVPLRKRQRVQIFDWLTLAVALECVPAREACDGRLRFTDDDEVRVIAEQLRQLRRGQPHEADVNAAGASLVRPRRLVLVIDERTEHDRYVGAVEPAARPDHLVPLLRENRREIRQMHAGCVVHPPFHHGDHARHARKRLETRAIPADNRIFRDDAMCRRQIDQCHTHYGLLRREPTPAEKFRDAAGGPRGGGVQARTGGARPACGRTAGAWTIV